jgi:UrcA family protein
MKMFILAIGVASLLAGPAPAQTQAEGAPVASPSFERLVSYDDLNLESEAGRAALARRIHLAARAVCPQRGRLLPMEPYRRACVSGAVESAWARVSPAAGVEHARGPRTVRVTARAEGF